MNQSWKGLVWIFDTVGEKGHVTIFDRLEVSALGTSKTILLH